MGVWLSIYIVMRCELSVVGSASTSSHESYQFKVESSKKK